MANFGQQRFSYDIEDHIQRITAVSTTAGTIPDEVIALVVDYLLDDFNHDLPFWRPKSDMKTKKKAIGAYRLTCRYWANLFKPCLYETVKLFSPGDYTGLVELMNRDSSVAPLVRRLHLFEMGSRPWTHAAVLSVDMKRLVNLRDAAMFYVSESTHAVHRAARPPMIATATAFGLTFHPFSQVSTLYLASQELPSLDYLLRALQRLPRLKTLYCLNLTWLSSEMRDHMRRPRLPQMHFISFMSTTDDAWAVFLMLNSTFDTRTDEVWSANMAVVHGIVDLCRSFYTTAASEVQGRRKELRLLVRRTPASSADRCTNCLLYSLPVRSADRSSLADFNINIVDPKVVLPAQPSDDTVWSTILPLHFRIHRHPNGRDLTFNMDVRFNLNPYRLLQDIDTLRGHAWDRTCALLSGLPAFQGIQVEFGGGEIDQTPAYANKEEVLRTLGTFVQYDILSLLQGVKKKRLQLRPSLWRAF